MFVGFTAELFRQPLDAALDQPRGAENHAFGDNSKPWFFCKLIEFGEYGFEAVKLCLSWLLLLRLWAILASSFLIHMNRM
jgi:hypothetical protein